MADAQDLKSWDRKKSCEFESHHRHQASLVARATLGRPSPCSLPSTDWNKRPGSKSDRCSHYKANLAKGGNLNRRCFRCSSHRTLIHSREVSIFVISKNVASPDPK